MIFTFDYRDIDEAQYRISKYIRGKKGKFSIEIVRSKEKRSLPQNRYYWGVVVHIISDHTGYTNEEIHQILKNEFLQYEKDGKIFTKSTTDLNTAEFSGFVDQIRNWASANLGTYIPAPNELTNEMYMQLHNSHESKDS